MSISEIRNKLIEENIESERNSYFSKLESFDNYKKRKLQIAIEQNDEYSKRIQNGYQVIIAQIEKILKEEQTNASNR